MPLLRFIVYESLFLDGAYPVQSSVKAAKLACIASPRSRHKTVRITWPTGRSWWTYWSPAMCFKNCRGRSQKIHDSRKINKKKQNWQNANNSKKGPASYRLQAVCDWNALGSPAMGHWGTWPSSSNNIFFSSL